MMSFEKSKEYKEAHDKYTQELYKDLLNPINIIKNWDEMYLFYDQERVEDLVKKLIELYKVRYDDESWSPEFPRNLWCSEPTIQEYEFMGIGYKSIVLRFDWEIDLMW